MATAESLVAGTELEPTLDAAQRSRAFVRAVLAEWDLRRFEDEAVLGVSELVANVVRHARTRVGVRVEWRARELRVEVADGSSVLPAVAEMAGERGGWGLRIVEAVSRRWGIEVRDDGKSVWFSLADGQDL